MEDLSGEQQNLNKDFGEVQKEIEDLPDLNQDLQTPYPIENTADDEAGGARRDECYVGRVRFPAPERIMEHGDSRQHGKTDETDTR